jgi:hypothetical protein
VGTEKRSEGRRKEVGQKERSKGADERLEGIEGRPEGSEERTEVRKEGGRGELRMGGRGERMERVDDKKIKVEVSWGHKKIGRRGTFEII